MKLYITKCITNTFSKQKLDSVRKQGSKILFPLLLNYRLEFAMDSYHPQMTNNRIPKEDILVFFLNLYAYTDKLIVLWLTFVGVFFTFPLLFKALTMSWRNFGPLFAIILSPVFYILTDMLGSFIIIQGMKVLKKNINAYINQKQAGFQQLGVRWKVSEDPWLTLELVLDYLYSNEAKQDIQEANSSLLKGSTASFQNYTNDVENSNSRLRYSFA